MKIKNPRKYIVKGYHTMYSRHGYEKKNRDYYYFSVPIKILDIFNKTEEDFKEHIEMVFDAWENDGISYPDLPKLYFSVFQYEIKDRNNKGMDEKVEKTIELIKQGLKHTFGEDILKWVGVNEFTNRFGLPTNQITIHVYYHSISRTIKDW